MSKNKKLKSMLYFSVACTALISAQSFADDTNKPVEKVSDEVVVVTAQKRAQSIQTLGMSITAMSANQLKSKGIETAGDLAKVVPGFSFSQSQKGAPVYTLRGVGFYEETLSASPAVSIYVNEFGYSTPLLAKGATLDVERVEVLKGPQGTLYGQNSTGGAINYIAAKPTASFKSGADLNLNNFGRSTINGYVSGAVSENIKMRLAASYDTGGAWQESASRGDKNGDMNVFKARLITQWDVTDKFSVNLNLNTWTDKSDTLAASLLALTVQTPTRLALSPGLSTQVPVRQEPGIVDWNAGYNLKADESFNQAALRMEYASSEYFKLTSLTSYSKFTQDDFRDTDGSPASVFAVNQVGNVKSFNQEIRGSGKGFDDKLNWVAGVYYAQDTTHERNNSILPLSTSASAWVGLGFSVFDGVYATTDQTAKTSAIFGNIDYDFNEQFSAHLGMRNTSTKTEFAGCMEDKDGKFAPGINVILHRINPTAPVVQPFGCVTVLPDKTVGKPYEADLNENNTSWRFGLDWKPVKGTLIFATASKGYKSGSFPNINATTFASFSPVTQESVLAYELGFKSNFGTSIAQINGSVFKYDYLDKQFRGRLADPLGVFGAVEALVNIPKSKVQGAELNGTLRPISGLTINAGITYLDTEITSSFNNYDPIGVATNFQGETFPFTPKYSSQIGVDYQFPINDALNAFVGVNASHKTKTKAAFGENAVGSRFPFSLVEIKEYTLIDAQLGVKSANDKWRLTLWGKNLTDEYYWTSAFRQIDNTSRHVGEPLSYGLRIGVEF